MDDVMDIEAPEAATYRSEAVIEGTDAVEVYRFDKNAKLRIDVVDGKIVTVADVVTGSSLDFAGRGWQIALVYDPDSEWTGKPTATLRSVS